MQNKIIQAIRNFDTAALQHLLDDDRSYMNVTKTLFIKTLDKQFQKAKNENCHAFDDVYFGICEHCNKGCEGMTFFSDSGFYLDLYIESKDEKSVQDIYVCNKLTNFNDLDKTMSLGFSFYKDEQLKFRPSQDYLLVKKQFRLLRSELRNLKVGIHLDDLENWYDSFSFLKNYIHNLGLFVCFEYKLYDKASTALHSIENIIAIKHHAESATDALIEFYLVKSERDKLIWYFENQKNKLSTYGFKIPKDLQNDCYIDYNLDKFKLTVDISGYEYIVDYFMKIDDSFYEFMEKFAPLPEHYKQSKTGYVECSLLNYLKLHNKHLDVVEMYQNQE